MTSYTPTSLAAAKWGGAVLLLTAILAFWLGADRGLDLTDESYYLLNYLYWRDLAVSFSLFGMYFSVPFNIFEESIAAIRIFGLGLLCAAASYFITCLYRYYNRHAATTITPNMVPEVIAGIACVLIYYAVLGTLRTPSYNLLVLSCLLLSSGILLDVTSSRQEPKKLKLKSFLYGFTISICFLTKAPAAAAVVFLHFIFYLLAIPKSASLSLPTVSAWASLGGLLNISIVTAVFPSWYTNVIAGIGYVRLVDHNEIWHSLTQLRWYFQETLETEWQVILPATVGYALAVRWAFRRAPRIIPILLVATIAVLSLWTAFTPRANSTPWIAGQFMAVCLLWSTGFLARCVMRPNQADAILAGLIALLFLLSIGFSWGSDIALKMHSKMAAILPLTACMLVLYQTRLAGTLKPTPYYGCLTLLCLPALVGQVTPWLNVEHTYRLSSPLSQQESRFVFGARHTPIYLDRQTYDEVSKLSAILGASGFRYLDPILDFTGDNPGLVFLAGAIPPGVSWLAGGYPNSLDAAKYALDFVDQETLRRAWIISSEDNPNRIANWRELLLARIPELRLEEVGQVPTHPNYPGMRRAPREFTLTIWRPSR